MSTTTEDTFLAEDRVGNIVIAADNITLNCKGNSVTGNHPDDVVSRRGGE